MSDEKKICPWCYYARDRKDVAGVYCTGGFENPDGTCEHFKDYEEMKDEESMNREELVNALRCCSKAASIMENDQKHIGALMADIENLRAERDVMRNELCLKCGTYKYAHEGACDGCRWKDGAK